MGTLGGELRTVPHSRFLRSIRMRILVPVLVASLSVVGLGAVQTMAAVATASQADYARALATASSQVVTFAHELAQELVEAGQLRRAGAGDPTAFDHQVAQTQQTEVAYAAALSTMNTVARLRPLADAAALALDGLSYVRTTVPAGGASPTTIVVSYSQALESVLAIADAVPAQLNDAHLVEVSRSLALVGELDRLGALQLDLVADGLVGHSLAPHDTRQLAEWVGQEGEQAGTLARLGPAGSRYVELMNTPAAAQAYRIRQDILDSQGAVPSADPTIWYAVQSERRTQLAVLRTEVDATLHRDAAASASAAHLRVFQTAGLSGGVAALTLLAGMRLAARTGRRLQRTRRAALAAARIELPAAITKVVAARDADDVRRALTDSWARIDAMLTTGTDEIGELASAFGAVHRQALRLAADQALLRMEVQALFVALSRRGQTLVQRQIQLIDEFGRDEIDPEALSRLFALDHLAARMRRNEENLLVLAGGEPGRWITRPVAVVDLIRAAAQEIEDYQRVEVGPTPPVAVAAHVAGDAIHLLAELIENATAFSPPSATVRVSAAQTGDGLTVTVVDEGIGIPEVRLTEANERLTRPSALTSTLVGTMGLLVVARLAERHQIGVRLVSTRARGTTATVTLPSEVVVALPGEQVGPAAAVPVGPLAPVVPTTPGAPAPHGVPLARSRRPAPGRPTLPAERAPDRTEHRPEHRPPEVTPAGLPRRRGQDPPPPDGAATPAPGPRPGPTPLGDDTPGDSQSPGDGAQPSPPAPAPEPPDPATVRARLASLAGGIAAAQRPEPGPPITHPSPED